MMGHQSSSLRVVRSVTQGKNPEAIIDAEFMEDSAYWLTLHGLLHLLFYTFQDITSSGLNPLISIILPHKPDMSKLVSN